MNFTWRRRYEVVVVGLGYSVLHLYVLDPWIGGVTGFDRPAIDPDGIAGGELVDVFTRPRGWIFFVSMAILFFGYIYLRPKLTGHDPSTFWNPSEDMDEG